MDERDRQTADREPRVERETTIITTGDGGGGGGGMVAAIVLLLAIVLVLFLLFGGGLQGAADDVDVNVDVEAPEMPDVDLPSPGNSG